MNNIFKTCTPFLMVMVFHFLWLNLTGCTGQGYNRTGITIENDKNSTAVISPRDSITLCWVKPDTNADLIDFYELFYRTDTGTAWILLVEKIPPTDTPSIKISRSQLTSNSSVFFFAVRSASNTGARSDYIMSTDSTSALRRGWYVTWYPK
jgi:hypothetical protein